MSKPPTLTFFVHTRNGDANALATVGRARAADFGLAAEIVVMGDGHPLASVAPTESVTAIVPLEFATAQHEAWCLLCQLSLLRCNVSFSILVLGAETDAAFVARQRALLTPTENRRPPSYPSCAA